MNVNDEQHTDALYLPGANIPVTDISIERIAAGQVIYRDARGRRHQRNMDDVGSLRFGNLPQLHRAEEDAERGEFGKAIPHFLQALVRAENDMQRLWIHARLARAHDIRSEYAQSCSHAAAVFLLEEHIVWRDMEPIREPVGDPPFAAVAEARHMLREAQGRITHRDLSQAITRMAQRIERMHEEMRVGYNGPPVQPRTTWSGISIDRILVGDIEVSPAADETAEPEPPPAPEVPTAPAPALEREAAPEDESAIAESAGRSAEDIDRMLTDGRFDEVLERCRRIERNMRNYDVARFLHQYGRALVGVERYDDAAVMFTRCAILYPTSEYAPAALIETAIIYRDHYHQPRTALRLLDRSAERLSDDSPAAVRDRIERLRSEIGRERGD